jgi:predicted acyltransferase
VFDTLLISILWPTSALGLLISLYGATAKRTLRGKPVDVQTRQLLILLGIYAVVMSLEMALPRSGWRFPFDNAVDGNSLVISSIFLLTVVSAGVQRRNHARATTAQNAQHSQETNGEVE